MNYNWESVVRPPNAFISAITNLTEQIFYKSFLNKCDGVGVQGVRRKERLR